MEYQWDLTNHNGNMVGVQWDLDNQLEIICGLWSSITFHGNHGNPNRMGI